MRHKEIADKLGISIHTVKSHVRALLRKLGARTCIEAIWKRRGG